MSALTMRRYIRVAAWLALMAWITAAAHGTTIERLSLGQMARSAPVIVRARCEGNSVVQDAGEIWTVTSFEVEETWRGEAPQRVTVRLLGGRMSEITSHVSGVPRFQPGEDVVLFLEPDASGDFSVVSWQQGTFRIRRAASEDRELVTQDTASFATFDPVTRRFRANGIRNMPLENFHAQVEAALKNGGRNQR